MSTTENRWTGPPTTEAEKAEYQRRVHEWWPPAGSCAEDCPHEIALAKRDAAMEKRRQEFRDDPDLAREAAAFHADIEVLRSGTPEGEALKTKWADQLREQDISTLTMLARETALLVDAEAEVARLRAALRSLDSWLEADMDLRPTQRDSHREVIVAALTPTPDAKEPTGG